MFRAAALVVSTLLAQRPPPSRPPDDRFRTVVETSDPRPQRPLGRETPGFGTAIELHDPADHPPQGALGEALARTPGAHVRATGGPSQFATVSLRGSAAPQVGVFTDGIPVGDSLGGMLNLADLPLHGLSGLKIYRGFVPVQYGGATLGGAIDLLGRPRNRHARFARLTLGLGSFGGRQLTFDGATPLGRDRLLSATVAYNGSRGDFAYYDDASTPTLTADDRTLRRVNNDADRVLARVRLDAERGPLQMHAQQWFVGRWSGIAGPVGSPSTAARLGTVAFRSTGSIEHAAFGRPGGRLGAWAGLGVRRQRFEDPLGELGPGRNDQRLVSIDGYASPRGRVALWRGAFALLTADVRPQWVRVDEAVTSDLTRPETHRGRVGGGVGLQLEQFAWQRRIWIVPVLRVDALISRIAAREEGMGPPRAPQTVTEVGFSPRIGARVRLFGPLELRASAGRDFRPPTLLELFGDRGSAVGNPDLRSERGTTLDGGFAMDHEVSGLRVSVQVAGFASWSHDLIAWIAAGRISRPVNLAAARIRGVESSVRFAVPNPRATLELGYTLTDAVDRGPDPTYRGQPLPGRPRHDAFGRAAVGRALSVRGVRVEPRLRASLEVVDGTRLDAAGRYRIPTRVLQGLGAELHVNDRVHASFEVRNLLDQRTGAVTLPVGGRSPRPVAISDFAGFPLPGRSVWATVTLDFGPP